MAWDLPVHGICSLDAVAAAALDAEPSAAGVCVALDARRKEVYWARYAGDGERREGPRVAAPATIDRELRSGAWAGNGAVVHADVFGVLVAAADDESSGACYPHAAWIGRRASALLAAGVAESLAEAVLDVHGDDSGATAHALTGATLLPPRPLYLDVPMPWRPAHERRRDRDAVVARAAGARPSRRSSSPQDPWSSEQFWQELAQPTRTYRVCVEGDEVVGYARHLRDAAGRRHPDGGGPRRSAGTRHRPAAAGRAARRCRRTRRDAHPAGGARRQRSRARACTSRSASSGSASAAGTTPTAATR